MKPSDSQKQPFLFFSFPPLFLSYFILTTNTNFPTFVQGKSYSNCFSSSRFCGKRMSAHEELRGNDRHPTAADSSHSKQGFSN